MTKHTKISPSRVVVDVLEEWKDRYDLTAGITTRGGEFDDFGLASQTPTATTLALWMALPDLVDGVFVKTCTGRQIHETTIVRHHKSDATRGWLIHDNVDGHVTGDAGLLLTITVADCVPVFLHAPDTGDIGLLHAGWRGIALGILETGIEEMRGAGADPSKLVLYLGPSICGDCYEVGADVAAQLGAPGQSARCVDLRAILAEKAGKYGVRTVETSTSCTKHDTSYHSYRRDGVRAGRMVAFLGRGLG